MRYSSGSIKLLGSSTHDGEIADEVNGHWLKTRRQDGTTGRLQSFYKYCPNWSHHANYSFPLAIGNR